MEKQTSPQCSLCNQHHFDFDQCTESAIKSRLISIEQELLATRLRLGFLEERKSKLWTKLAEVSDRIIKPSATQRELQSKLAEKRRKTISRLAGRAFDRDTPAIRQSQAKLEALIEDMLYGDDS